MDIDNKHNERIYLFFFSSFLFCPWNTFVFLLHAYNTKIAGTDVSVFEYDSGLGLYSRVVFFFKPSTKKVTYTSIIYLAYLKKSSICLFSLSPSCTMSLYFLFKGFLIIIIRSNIQLLIALQSLSCCSFLARTNADEATVD